MILVQFWLSQTVGPQAPDDDPRPGRPGLNRKKSVAPRIIFWIAVDWMGFLDGCLD